MGRPAFTLLPKDVTKPTLYMRTTPIDGMRRRKKNMLVLDDGEEIELPFDKNDLIREIEERMLRVNNLDSGGVRLLRRKSIKKAVAQALRSMKDWNFELEDRINSEEMVKATRDGDVQRVRELLEEL